MSVIAFPLFPDQASDLAQSVDWIFFGLMAVCIAIIVLVGAVALLFCIRYRHGSPASREMTMRSPAKLEIAWTLAPLVIFMGLFVWAGVVYFKMASPPADAVEYHVIGKQWMWKIQHPDGRREVNELHLPLGHPVKLVMTSQDVIHDFYVPAFRTKSDVLPDRYTAEWFTPTKPGRYHLFCSEYCGTDHSKMIGTVYVMRPAEYSAWLERNPPAESLALAGERSFNARGCSGCHAKGSTVHAPLLNGLAGRPVALKDGTIVTADDQYLRDSILLPNKQVAAGFDPVMPTYEGQLTDEEVIELIAYIRTLSQTSPQP